MGNLKSYIAGFTLSVVLTISAFLPVYIHVGSRHSEFSHEFITIFVIILAMIQLIVQLVFFLHLLNESKPRWNLVIFISTISIVLIIVLGSIWIMQHLNYNMTSQDMNKYIFKNEGMH